MANSCNHCHAELSAEKQGIGVFRCDDCRALNACITPDDSGNVKFRGYTVKEEVGQGANAVVHRALDERGDIYALKLFASNAHIEQHSSKEFKRESESATFVSHQNIIRIFEAGVEESIPYVLMEFIDGINLSERLDQIGPLREEVAIAVGIDVCKALDFVWNEEMKIHRDIKPQNIMISKAGDVKVCDFGMVVDHDASMVDLDNVEGTPYYLSPECISEGAYLDNRSDIYSLGASLYHVVSGFPPFDYGSVMKVIQARTKEDPPDVRKMKESVSEGFANVLLTMMAQSPDHRYATAAECADDLMRLIEGEPPVLVDHSRIRRNEV